MRLTVEKAAEVPKVRVPRVPTEPILICEGFRVYKTVSPDFSQVLMPPRRNRCGGDFRLRLSKIGIHLRNVYIADRCVMARRVAKLLKRRAARPQRTRLRSPTGLRRD